MKKNVLVILFIMFILSAGCIQSNDSTGEALKSFAEKETIIKEPLPVKEVLPSIPTALTAFSGSNTGQINLDWDYSDENVLDGNIVFEIYWWVVPDYNSSDYNESDYNGTIYSNLTYLIHSSPTPSATALLHYYKIKACDSFGCSNWSNTATAYPKLGAGANGPYFALTEQSMMLNGDALYPLEVASYSWVVDFNSSDPNSSDLNSSGCIPSISVLQNPTITCFSAGTANIVFNVTAQNGTAIDYAVLTVIDDNSSSSNCPYYDKTTGTWIPCLPK